MINTCQHGRMVQSTFHILWAALADCTDAPGHKHKLHAQTIVEASGRYASRCGRIHNELLAAQKSRTRNAVGVSKLAGRWRYAAAQHASKAETTHCARHRLQLVRFESSCPFPSQIPVSSAVCSFRVAPPTKTGVVRLACFSKHVTCLIARNSILSMSLGVLKSSEY